MATQEYTQLDSPIRFPQNGVDWKDERSGSVTVPARTLETGDTLSYEETGVVYTYDSVVYTWTGDFSGGGGAPLVVSLTWANALDEFKRDNEVVAVTGVGTDGALTDGVSYKYEWYRQDPADDSSTLIKTETVTDNFTPYTLTDDDVGFVIWVSVEATDVDGNVATANTPKNGEVGAPDPVTKPDTSAPIVIPPDVPHTWETLDFDKLVTGTINSVIKATDENIFLGTRTGGLWRSETGVEWENVLWPADTTPVTWDHKNTHPGDSLATQSTSRSRTHAVNKHVATSNNTIMVLHMDDRGELGTPRDWHVYFSDDQGDTWTHTVNPTGFPSTYTQSPSNETSCVRGQILGCDDADNPHMYAVFTTKKVYITTDKGVTWTEQNCSNLTTGSNSYPYKIFEFDMFPDQDTGKAVFVVAVENRKNNMLGWYIHTSANYGSSFSEKFYRNQPAGDISSGRAGNIMCAYGSGLVTKEYVYHVDNGAGIPNVSRYNPQFMYYGRTAAQASQINKSDGNSEHAFKFFDYNIARLQGPGSDIMNHYGMNGVVGPKNDKTTGTIIGGYAGPWTMSKTDLYTTSKNSYQQTVASNMVASLAGTTAPGRTYQGAVFKGTYFCQETAKKTILIGYTADGVLQPGAFNGVPRTFNIDDDSQPLLADDGVYIVGDPLFGYQYPNDEFYVDTTRTIIINFVFYGSDVDNNFMNVSATPGGTHAGGVAYTQGINIENVAEEYTDDYGNTKYALYSTMTIDMEYSTPDLYFYSASNIDDGKDDDGNFVKLCYKTSY